MIVKSIKDLAWNVSEEEYRADSAVSYSTLSQFDREGVSCIPHRLILSYHQTNKDHELSHYLGTP